MKTPSILPCPHTNPTTEELASFLYVVHQEVARMLRRVPRCVEKGDLVAAGNYGLLDALRKNPERGPAFPAYARLRVRGAMVDELRSQDWLSRRARARTTQATSDGTAGGTYVMGLDDLPPGQELADEEASNPLELIERHTDRAALANAVALLPEREANVVKWHYIDDVPFNVIAGRLGVTGARVSQLHSRALDMLRTRFEAAREEAVAA